MIKLEMEKYEMNDITLRQWIFRISALLWMLVIFFFSAQPATVSTQTSLTVGRKICSIFVRGYGEKSEKEKTELAEKIEYPIRKMAHATEYAILAILFLNAMTISAKNAVFALLYTACYAMTDEFHQLFVPGRSGQITDVLIDTGGAICGICLVYVIIKAKKVIWKSNDRR